MLRTTDPDFYVELTTGTAAEKVPESEEEESEDTGMKLDDLEDDSNLPCDVVVVRVLDRTRMSLLLLSNSTGGLSSAALADSIDATPEASSSETADLGEAETGKRKCRSNTLYSSSHFWRHHDQDGSDNESYS